MLDLDENILVGAVLGKRVRALLTQCGERIEFVAPDVAFDEARKHLPQVIVRTVDHEAYSGFESVARQRPAGRDEDDWPILAAAVALSCPIWTEDMDFFGCGVAIWTTDKVELCLTDASSDSAVEQ